MQAVSTLNLCSAHGGGGGDYLFLEDEEAAPMVSHPISPPAREGQRKRFEPSCYLVADQLQ